MRKKLYLVACLALCAAILCGCTASQYEQSEPHLLPASSLGEYLGKEGVVIVDMQSEEGYAAEHVAGAVNLQSSDIVINVPVSGMLTSAKKLQRVLGERGIGNDTTIIAYDNNRMSAARLFWTLMCYQSDKVYVIDGGLDAIKAAGYELTADVPEVTPAEYVCGEKTDQWLATMADVQKQLDEPDKNTVLLDVRSDAEYAENGKIPSSILWDYSNQFYSDGTMKDTQTVRINFVNQGMRPEKNLIVYCQSSMRAAPVFLKLYDAGYRNIRIYDGAYLEWSQNPANAIDMPSGAIAPNQRDAS